MHSLRVVLKGVSIYNNTLNTECVNLTRFVLACRIFLAFIKYKFVLFIITPVD